MRKNSNSKNGGYSNLCLLICAILLFWIAVILYSFHTGYLHKHQENPTMVVLDTVISNAENNIKGKVDKLMHLRIHNSIQNSDIHVVFSTDCSEYQDWQTIVVFHSAQAVHQEGPVTRIASGCTPEKQVQLTQLYKHIFPDYHVHFTPDFKSDGKTNQKYDFYNKPYGVQHWLLHADPPIREGVVIALIDPDMIFLRPLSTKLKGMPNNLIPKYVKEEEVFDKVGRGHALGQLYGLGAPWTRDVHRHFNKTGICDPGSPCLTATETFGDQHFSVGPPYMLEKTDMVRLVDTWVTLVPRVFAQYPYLLAEMYAYSMAAAHENLPHLQVFHHMISNIDAGNSEGWPLISALDDVCLPPVKGIYHPDKPLPTFMHFCQGYDIGELGFAKRRLRTSIFTCEHDLLLDPADEVDSSLYILTEQNVESINAALMFYKEKMCANNPNTSYKKTVNVMQMVGG